MTFRVGQEVVCVNDSPHECGAITNVKKDHVYTVRGHCGHGDGDGVWLAEIRPRGNWCCYDPARFRPAVKPKRKASTETGMTLLREIADRETVREPSKAPADYEP